MDKHRHDPRMDDAMATLAWIQRDKKLIRSLREENARLTEDRNFWRNDAKRLRDEIKRLRGK